MKIGIKVIIALTVIVSSLHVPPTAADSASNESGPDSSERTYRKYRRPFPWYPQPKPRPPTCPPPPLPKCDICTDVSSGFADTLKYLKQIDEKVEKMSSDCPAGITFESGQPVTNPGAVSSVVCPDNTTVLDCRCSVDNRVCLGSIFVDNECLAIRNTLAQAELQALATCVPTCSGPYIYQTTSNKASVATCPDNTKIVGCWMRYINQVPETSTLATRINPSAGTCQPAVACSAGECGVQAICKASVTPGL
ncbi:uncharacterized protein LOC135464137 [Liolophura sinensis]|uniref:uncharacterized protein LOC135464137 n=1 Tax=Liolophura sinensis TaxID=3198878 RepID=UPI003158DABD